MPARRNDQELEAMVMAFTEVTTPVLCPEIRLWLKPSSETFESFHSRLPARFNGPPPFWSVAWPGGQALARYLIDNRTVSGLRVADLGAGSGLASIAAMMSGALSARAIDQDLLALAAARANSRLNCAAIEPVCEELATTNLEGVHVVLAGDLWYESVTARRANVLLRRLAQAGLTVLAGDPRRSYFPRSRRRLLATYQIPVSQELETGAVVAADVWRLQP